MPLKMILDSIDDLDETTQSFYKQKDGKYVLDVGGDVASHPEVEKLSNALKKERESVRELKNDLSNFKKTYENIDPAKFEEMQKQLSDFQKQQQEEERKKAEKKEQWEKLEKDLQSRHQEELQTYQQKIEAINKEKEDTIGKMKSTLENEIKEKGIVSAIAEAKGNQTILKPHVDAHVQVVETEEGDYQPRVIDQKGNVRINSQGQPMAISDFIGELKQKPEFQGDGIFEKEKQDGGSGSGGNRGSGNSAPNPWKSEEFNLTEQSKIYKDDPQLAEKMKQEAGKG